MLEKWDEVISGPSNYAFSVWVPLGSAYIFFFQEKVKPNISIPGQICQIFVAVVSSIGCGLNPKVYKNF